MKWVPDTAGGANVQHVKQAALSGSLKLHIFISILFNLNQHEPQNHVTCKQPLVVVVLED